MGLIWELGPTLQWLWAGWLLDTEFAGKGIGKQLVGMIQKVLIYEREAAIASYRLLVVDVKTTGYATSL